MQKSIFPIAIAILVTFIALLIACGEGEPINLEDNQAQADRIREAMRMLTDPNTGLIISCVGGGYGCPPEGSTLQSSSGGDGTSSDSGSGEPPYSSGGSSDSSTPSSSDGPQLGEGCPSDIKDYIPEFSCSWSPAEVVAGETSKLSLSVSSTVGNINCAPDSAWLPIFGCEANVSPEACIKRDTAYFSFNKDIKTSGAYQSMKHGGSPLPEDMREWPRGPYSFVVTGEITCTGTGGGLGETFKCPVSKACSPLTIKEAPPPDSSNIDITCPWASFTVAGIEGYLLEQGADVRDICRMKQKDNSKPIIPDKSVDCGTPSIVYCDGSVCGTQPTELHSAVIGDKTVKAVVTCQGGPYTLKTLKYKVVANPSVMGTCSWNTGNSSNTSKPTFPSGYRVLNSYGRCGGIISADSLLATGAYYYSNGTTPWPSNGLLANAGTYSDVKPTITCNGFPGITFDACPSLQVVKINCTANLDNYCPGLDWGDVIWEAKQTGYKFINDFPQAKQAGGACVYFTKVTSLHTGGDATVKVNGTNYPGGSYTSVSVSKVDGGYYVYANLSGEGDIWLNLNPDYISNATLQTEPSIPPVCAVGDRLYCTGLLSQWREGTAITKPTVTCNGGAVGSLNFSPSNLNWTSPAIGGYDVKVSTTCGSTNLTAECGTVNVLASSSMTSLTIGNSDQTLNPGTTYWVTWGSDKRNGLMCTTNGCSDMIVNGTPRSGCDYKDEKRYIPSGDPIFNSNALITVTATKTCKLDWNP